MTGSLQSSTLILCVLSSRRVCATFIGDSLSMIAFRSNAMDLSMSAISLLHCKNISNRKLRFRKPYEIAWLSVIKDGPDRDS